MRETVGGLAIGRRHGRACPGHPRNQTIVSYRSFHSGLSARMRRTFHVRLQCLTLCSRWSTGSKRVSRPIASLGRNTTTTSLDFRSSRNGKPKKRRRRQCPIKGTDFQDSICRWRLRATTIEPSDIRTISPSKRSSRPLPLQRKSGWLAGRPGGGAGGGDAASVVENCPIAS